MIDAQDIALIFDPRAIAADIGLGVAGLETDETFLTALWISLFTDGRARPDDRLPHHPRNGNYRPAPSEDRRGWWGDALDVAQRRAGSRLWLLAREKASPDVLARAEFYAREALTRDFIQTGIAARIEARGYFLPDESWGIEVQIFRADQTAPIAARFDHVWRAFEGRA